MTVISIVVLVVVNIPSSPVVAAPSAVVVPAPPEHKLSPTSCRRLQAIDSSVPVVREEVLHAGSQLLVLQYAERFEIENVVGGDWAEAEVWCVVLVCELRVLEEAIESDEVTTLGGETLVEGELA